jgi:hypothetical protein
LHDVFRFPVIPEYGARNTVEALVVPPHDDFIQGSVSRPHPVNDLLVGPPFGAGFFQDSIGFHGSPTIEQPQRKRLQPAFPKEPIPGEQSRPYPAQEVGLEKESL